MNWLILLVCLPLAYSEEPGYEGHQLISYQANNAEDVEFLASLQNNPDLVALDFWTDPSLIRPTDIRVPPAILGKVQQAFRDAGREYTILHDNMQEVVEKEALEREQLRKSRMPGSSCNIGIEYCTLSEIEALTDELVSQFPGRITKWSIGESSEGRPISVVKIAWDLEHSHNGIWVEAGTHAREWVSVSTAVNLIDTLTRAETHDVEQLLHKYDWYIVPVHNPDGYSYSHESTNNRFWRKNRQACNGNSIGTDLNRNWDIAWMTAGTSSQCSSDTYGGSAAFSAPETRALRDAIENSWHPKAFFSIHSYSQLMLVPYAYKHEHPGRYSSLKQVADVMMADLRDVDGRVFRVGTPPDILYAASGGAYDYMYEMVGLKWSYTYELRPTSAAAGGFDLSPSQIDVSFREVFASLKAFAHVEKDDDEEEEPLA